MIRQINFRQQIDTDGKRKLTPEGESKFMLTIKDFKIKSQLTKSSIWKSKKTGII